MSAATVLAQFGANHCEQFGAIRHCGRSGGNAAAISHLRRLLAALHATAATNGAGHICELKMPTFV